MSRVVENRCDFCWQPKPRNELAAEVLIYRQYGRGGTVLSIHTGKDMCVTCAAKKRAEIDA